jgi:hypothetical protein
MENNFELRRLIQNELEKCGVKVPAEEKFDYSGFDKPDLLRNFIKICNGYWKNSIYVRKYGQRYEDTQYFDLLFVVNEFGHPNCIPIPIARKLFNEEIVPEDCLHIMSGSIYEYIYKVYYVNEDLPF